MTMNISHFAAGLSGAGWLPLADAILKATLLFALAAIASIALRRRTAAARHLMWALALISALALPALSLALPRWQLPLVTVASTSVAVEKMSAAQPLLPTGPMAPALKRTHTDRATTAAQSVAAGPAQTPVVSSRLSLPNISWPYALLAVWAAGAALVLLRLATGLLVVLWLSRRTERVTDAPWLPLARALAAELEISPRLVFLRSQRSAMPMAWGILRPSVLMPADADSWPSDRLRIVLLHELAHVKRRDCLTHMLAQISCALYWFNPLAWMAARHLRTERERACDDLVLAAGTRGPDYADQLLEIARAMRSGRFPALFGGASLAMAQRSQLEGRLMAILDPTVPRSGVSRSRTVAATLVFAGAVMPLAAVQPWTSAAGAPATVSAAATADGTTQLREGETPLVQTTPTPSTTPAPRVQPAPAVKPTPAPQPQVASAADMVSAAIAETAVEAVRAGVESTVPSIVNSVLGAVSPDVRPHVATRVHMDQNDNSGGDKARKADPRTIAALTTALKDVDKDVRETALQALVQLRDPSIFEPLVQALADATADVREHAAFGLGQIRDKRAVEPLTRALKDQNGDVREQAAFALGQLRDRSAVSALTAALKDIDADVREQAVFALAQLKDPSTVDALALAAHDAKADVRQQAVFALGQIRDARAVETLISALKDADAEVREQAAFALGQIRDHGAVEALIVALKDTVPDVREQVAFALGQIRDPRALDALTSALKDASADVRQQAAFALGQLAR
jgi:HEAT repeat protein/beta-lactamase regulating signal transducer with metallopeptidase domain